MEIADTHTRPWCGKGDAEPHQIFYAVGQAVTFWEMAEQAMAELVDAMISKAETPAKSDRAGFMAFVDEPAGTRRIVFLKKKADELAISPALQDRLLALVKVAFELSDRRNQIAHGMVLNLGDYGYCLGPSNLQKVRWEREGQFGAAQYQYVAADILHYAAQFEMLRSELHQLMNDVRSFNSRSA